MKKELITFYDTKSPISETFKALRTNLQFMNAGKNIQVILITSTLPAEGKSWTVANLAITFAQAGNKVVIIDADMRKGRQFNLFDVSPRPGLSNYLSGVVNSKNSIDIENPLNFVQETEIENLYVVSAGDIPPNPSELLITPKMISMLETCKKNFDVVIIDTPPAMLVTDSKILSRLADTSLIIAAHKVTKMDNLNKMKKEIENVGGKVGGIVLNKVPLQSKKYENGYYYGETSLSLKNNKKKENYADIKLDVKESKNTYKQINEEKANKSEEKTYKDIKNNGNTEKEYNNATKSNNEESLHEYATNSSSKEDTKNTTENTNKENVYKDVAKESNEGVYNDMPMPNVSSAFGEITIDKTQDLLKQINSYLDSEKRKLNSGDKND